MTNKLIIALALLGLIVFGEYARCKRNDLPPSISVSVLVGPVGEAVKALGTPDRRFTLEKGDLVTRGVEHFVFHPQDLAQGESSTVEILLWKKSCFVCLSRQFLVVADPNSGQVIHFDASATGWLTPVIILGNGCKR